MRGRVKRTRPKKGKRPGSMDRYRRHVGTRVSPGVRVSFWGMLGDCAVWIVDGEQIRDVLFCDFTMGGSDARYEFIPPREIWIDRNLSSHDRRATLLHEAVERGLMIERGWTYGRAHDVATAKERVFREQTAPSRQARYRRAV